MPLHKPVMAEEVVGFLKPQPSDVIVDCTVGAAGHSRKLLEAVSGRARLIGIDKDGSILETARRNLKDFGGSYELIASDFRHIKQILYSKGVKGIDALLFDLGVGSYQLDNPERGFSFNLNGPLDMRMDESSQITACGMINRMSEAELSEMLFRLGQDRWHGRIARAIVRSRRQRPITTTRQLVEAVLRAVPAGPKKYKIHPATRTFQALRMAVNSELESLRAALTDGAGLLNPAGRICVISFHSLEDGTVKRFFRQLSAEGRLEILTKKPVTPARREVRDNPRSRSAKLRAAARK